MQDETAQRAMDGGNAAAGGPAPAPSVLLVDDEDQVREIATDLLRESGCEVHSFADGAAALAALEAGLPVSVLMVDLLMPGMHGEEFARQARARRPDLPVVFVTGNADPDLVERAGGLVVAKPYRLRELLAVLRRAAASGGPEPGA